MAEGIILHQFGVQPPAQSSLLPLHAVSLRVQPGEIVAVVGSHDAGLSTLGHALTGPLPAGVTLRGRARVNGVNPQSASAPVDQQAAHIGPQPMLNARYSLGRQLSDALLHARFDRRDVDRRAGALLRAVGLGSHYGSTPATLSVLQRHQADLALALAGGARVLVSERYGEESDVFIRAELRALLRDARDYLDLAILFLTQDVGAAADIADRVAALHDGHLTEAVAARRFFATPPSTRAKDLIAAAPRLSVAEAPSGRAAVARALRRVRAQEAHSAQRARVGSRGRAVDADLSGGPADGADLADTPEDSVAYGAPGAGPRTIDLDLLFDGTHTVDSGVAPARWDSSEDAPQDAIAPPEEDALDFSTRTSAAPAQQGGGDLSPGELSPWHALDIPQSSVAAPGTDLAPARRGLWSRFRGAGFTPSAAAAQAAVPARELPRVTAGSAAHDQTGDEEPVAAAEPVTATVTLSFQPDGVDLADPPALDSEREPLAQDAEELGSAIDISGLRVIRKEHWYGGGRACLVDIDLTVARGETLGILGTSGSGTTALLETVHGHLSASHGSVQVLGHQRRRTPGSLLATPSTALLRADPRRGEDPDETVADHLSAALRAGLTNTEDVDLRFRSRQLLEEVLLPKDALNQRLGSLDGLQRRALALAAALAAAPPILLLDEPVLLLDPVAAQQWLTLLGTVRDRRRLTLLITSHDPASLVTIVDRAVIMHQGRIVESGIVPGVLTDPTHPVTERLVWSVPVPNPLLQKRRRELRAERLAAQGPHQH